jgi:hypothetical protein
MMSFFLPPQMELFYGKGRRSTNILGIKLKKCMGKKRRNNSGENTCTWEE